MKEFPFNNLIEGLIVCLDLVSILVVAFLLYTIGRKLLASRAIEEQEEDPINKSALAVWGLLLISTAVGSLSATHLLVRTSPALSVPIHFGVGPWPAIASLLVGMVGCASFYGLLRPHLKRADATQDFMIFCAAMWIIVVSITVFLFWLGEKGGPVKPETLNDGSFAQHVNTFAQIAGILIAATMIVVTNRRNARQADETSRIQIYQALELESMKLFRFESNAPVAKLLWECKTMPCGTDEYEVKEYICQILNLFEMACRFRRKDIMETEVFGSWVIWIWEMCERPIFAQQWQKQRIEHNYVEALRKLITVGLLLNDQSSFSQSYELRRTAFFVYAATKFASEKECMKWLTRTQVKKTEIDNYLSRASNYAAQLGSMLESKPYSTLHRQSGMAEILIRPLSPEDRAQWEPLWQGYLTFYKTSVPDEVTETTFARFFNEAEPMHALVAERGGEIVGIVHYIFHRSTWTEGLYCYLQDLFTAEQARGGGVGRKLIEAVYDRAREQGASRVYWLTQEGNATARALYDKLAERSGFIQYRKLF